ncbi:MAG: DUF4105 domain-containing protein [Elusimicrobiales bacterium]
MTTVSKLIAIAALFLPPAGWGHQFEELQLGPKTAVGMAVPAPQASEPAHVKESGQEITNGYKSPPELVSSGPKGITIAHVKWITLGDGKNACYTASINPDMLKEAYWGIDVDKGSGVGHSFLVFKFKPGGFVKQGSGAYNSDTLVVSVEAKLRWDQDYSATAGAFGAFKILWLLYSMENYIQDTFPGEVARIEMFSVNASLDKKKAVLKVALDRAVQNRDSEYYNTITNNCTTNPMDMLATGIGFRYPIGLIMPKHATKWLKSAGIVSQTPLLFTEKDPAGHGFIKELLPPVE